MKSAISSHLRTVLSGFLLISGIVADACGPYNPIIPTPDFFADTSTPEKRSDAEQQENLILWQQLTSTDIPLKDIKEAVYDDNYQTFHESVYNSKPGNNNRFYAYLRNYNDDEVKEFLSTAKLIFEKRSEAISPWYYPESKQEYSCNYLSGLYQTCVNAHASHRLADRYALQAVRCLFSMRKYAECVEYFEKTFDKYPDSNLFKRMAINYVAGCWTRLGNIDKANELFANSDDIYSIKNVDLVEYMSERNPDSPALIEHIRSLSNDSARLCAIKPLAEKILSENRVQHRGDWEFVLAYIAGHHQKDIKTASKHIRRALTSKFSTDNFRDHARAYRMQINAENGDRSTLLDDLAWLERRIHILAPDANEWNRILQNIVYAHWVPVLWNRKDYATAIALCGYADKLFISRQLHHVYESQNHDNNYALVTLDEIRHNPLYFNYYDYTDLSFRLMESLSSSQLISVKHNIKADTPLYTFLRRYARTDTDYFNELISTLALREENYDRAIQYLSKVSQRYNSNLNTCSEGYLSRNPFAEYPNNPYNDKSLTPENAKLSFARKMQTLLNKMNKAATADERGMARLRYAIARKRSFADCWALTQYRKGYILHLFIPALDYWEDDFNRLDFLYSFDDSEGCNALFEKEANEALAMLTSDEARAQAHYILGNLKTIVKNYPDTPSARFLKTHCDNWSDWI